MKLNKFSIHKLQGNGKNRVLVKSKAEYHIKEARFRAIENGSIMGVQVFKKEEEQQGIGFQNYYILCCLHAFWLCACLGGDTCVSLGLEEPAGNPVKETTC